MPSSFYVNAPKNLLSSSLFLCSSVITILSGTLWTGLGEVEILKTKVAATGVSSFVKNHGELKFAFIQVTTKCNAMCMDRCNIWASRPFDMKLQDITFAIDVLAKKVFLLFISQVAKPDYILTWLRRWAMPRRKG